jgi:DUF1680 family protein
MAAQAQAARDFYLSLDENSLLQGFRLRAGLPAPGSPMGGWYDPEGFAGAHSFGQYVSALARMYANTGDRRFQAKVVRLVHGFHETIGADGYFYASAKVAREWPCYVYDKNAAGMRDAFTLTGDKEALVVLSKMTDWAVTQLPRRSDEWYTLSEGFYLDYALTQEARYLKLADEFDYSSGFFDLLAGGTNAFTPDRQAYSHVNSLSSAAETFEATGNPKYLLAAQMGWKYLTETQMYASGGWGPSERFVTPGEGKLAQSLQTSSRSFETPCGSYANVKLNRYLMRFTGASKYGDNMERVLLNGMLSALPNQSDGRTFYYSDYTPGTQKRYFKDPWPCCSGTFAQITADYPLDIYFHDDQAIYVNLFAQSSVKWDRSSGTIVLKQTTNYPLTDETSIAVRLAHKAKFTLSIRIPHWLKSMPLLKLNGVPLNLHPTSGSFLAIAREWSDGDVLTVNLPQTLRFEPIAPETPNRAALMYGPLLLVALSDKDVSLQGDITQPNSWIKAVRNSLSDFATEDGTLFRPLYLIRDERYTTYPLLSKGVSTVHGALEQDRSR